MIFQPIFHLSKNPGSLGIGECGVLKLLQSGSYGNNKKILAESKNILLL
jgi:hypothetical protein